MFQTDDDQGLTLSFARSGALDATSTGSDALLFTFVSSMGTIARDVTELAFKNAAIARAAAALLSDSVERRDTAALRTSSPGASTWCAHRLVSSRASWHAEWREVQSGASTGVAN
eukprot:scaffold1378_cov257-Pinguiococcus_pyrenoidosus.AAC.12